MNSKKRLLFYSQYASHRPLYAVFETLCASYDLAGFIITHENTKLHPVYEPSGILSPQTVGLQQNCRFVTLIPNSLTLPQKVSLLKRKVLEISPDYIWAHEEPSDYYVNHILRWFYFQSSPRIVVPVVENVWPASNGYRSWYARPQRKLLWRRYDAILGAASKSIQAIRRFGMPENVPLLLAWQPQLCPPATGRPRDTSFLPRKEHEDVFVGFAGRITSAKGWRILLQAIAQLPEMFKCLLAGTGEEEAELLRWADLPQLRGRVHLLGLLEKDRLWEFYRALDIFVLPSLTTPHWTEQFGAVLAEAMACGVPVIGSSSGAIPEVVGENGVIVQENNPAALAQAILSLARDPVRRAALAQKGRERFEQEYSYNAYARKIARALELQ
jgi:glycosyltransferase involved in cell wall biosynthesis